MRTCTTCGEPEEGEFGWFDRPKDDGDGTETVCLSCGMDPLKKRTRLDEEE